MNKFRLSIFEIHNDSDFPIFLGHSNQYKTPRMHESVENIMQGLKYNTRLKYRSQNKLKKVSRIESEQASQNELESISQAKMRMAMTEIHE